MNSKINPAQQPAASGADIAKYAIAAALAIAGLFVWFWFSVPARATQFGEWTPQLRGLAVVVGLAAGALVFLATAKGRDVREFLSESRFELRKVVWPTRQETTRMAWVVVIAVIIVSLVLFGFDFLVQKAIQWFLGR